MTTRNGCPPSLHTRHLALRTQMKWQFLQREELRCWVCGGEGVLKAARISPGVPCSSHRHLAPRGAHPDNVVDAVDIGVSHVDTDGAQREAVLLARALDGDGGTQPADGRRVVPARGGVSRGRIGGERARGHGASERGASVGVHCRHSRNQRSGLSPHVCAPEQKSQRRSSLVRAKHNHRGREGNGASYWIIWPSIRVEPPCYPGAHHHLQGS